VHFECIRRRVQIHQEAFPQLQTAPEHKFAVAATTTVGRRFLMNDVQHVSLQFTENVYFCTGQQIEKYLGIAKALGSLRSADSTLSNQLSI
jgi:hypothetical protein